jgi:nitroreductase
MNVRLTRRRVLAALAGAVALRPGAARAAAGGALEDLLARRRMVRRFTAEPVSEAQVRRLLAAARRAPSAGNTQPWAFVVVRERKTRRALARAALGQTFVAEAPVAIVACADAARARSRYGARGDHYSVVDTAFASMCLLLAVVEEGLGACFVGALDEGAVARILGLPARVRPLAVIPVGHPAERPRRAKLRPLDEMVRRERW